MEPKKIKGRPAKETQKNNTRKPKKPCGIAKGARQHGNTSKPLGNRTKTKTSLTKGGKQHTLSGRFQRDNAGKYPTRHPDIRTNAGAAGEESGLDDQRTEVNPLEGPLSEATSLQSEASIDSYRGEELNPASVDTLSLEHEERERRNSDSEEQEDDRNSDIEHDGYEEDDDDFIDGEGTEYNEDFTSGDVECDVIGDVIRGVDAEASGCDSDACAVTSMVVPAKNLQGSQDGQGVVLWTR